MDYCSIGNVKVVLQIGEDMWDSELAESVTSAGALLDGFLCREGLAVPLVVPQVLVDNANFFAAWDFRRHRVPVGAEVFWVEANRVLGEQFTLGNLPKAIINAEPSPIYHASLGSRFQVKVAFSVVLMILEYEPKNWFKDVVTVMADVVEAVLADRSLGGKVKDGTPVGFAPG